METYEVSSITPILADDVWKRVMGEEVKVRAFRGRRGTALEARRKGLNWRMEMSSEKFKEGHRLRGAWFFIGR